MQKSLADWLALLERRHPRSIELGLDRVSRVREAMALSPSFPIITVGGTNGKGSTCAMLEAMLSAAGYRVGLYASPHLLRYNERVRIAMREATDESLLAAFERMETARADTPLTYFEFGTLAAVDLFVRHNVDVAVLEVGLGGRLDAVNAFDADCSVVTTVDFDHMEYLGHTRDAIGYEKAGIYRRARPAICCDEDPPSTLLAHARDIGADLQLMSRDFGYRASAHDWQYWSAHGRKAGLPHPALRGRYQLGNAAGAIAALEALHERLPVEMGAIRRGLVEVALPGRLQILPGRPQVVLDVAHNPQAARVLDESLHAMPRARTLAVFGMLMDKDVAGVVKAMAESVDHWLLCSLQGPRGASAEHLREAVRAVRPQAPIEMYPDPGSAYRRARELARGDDRIVAFGSFYTVSGVLQGTG